MLKVVLMSFFFIMLVELVLLYLEPLKIYYGSARVVMALDSGSDVRGFYAKYFLITIFVIFLHTSII